MHGHVETLNARQAGRRQAALQGLCEPFCAMLMAQRPASTRLLVLDLGDERLTVSERVESFLGRLLAITRCGLAILTGQLAIRGGLRTALSRAAESSGGTDDRSGAALLARVVVLLEAGVELGHRDGAGGGGLVAQLSGEIAAAGDRVATVGGAQPRPPGLVAPAGGLLALARRVLADVLAELVRPRIGAVREITIARDLIAIGGQLITVRACLILLRARLICIGQRLIAVGERLLVSDPPRIRVGDVLLSLARAVNEAHGRIG
jgi:hypothetical protein